MEQLLEGIQTMEEAVKVANEIERLESAIKTLKDNLKKFVDANGPVDTGEKIWGYSQSESWKFTPEQLKKVAEGIVLDGKNPWEYLNITAGNVRKLGWADDVLAQYGEKRTTNRFSGKKAN